jgi:hypothetical protein
MKLAPLVLAVPVILSTSCIGDIADSPDEPGLDDQGIHYGHGNAAEPSNSAEATLFWLRENRSDCADACFGIYAGSCGGWKATCEEGHDTVTCAGQALTCTAARVAAYEKAPLGLEYCRRECEGIH